MSAMESGADSGTVPSHPGQPVGDWLSSHGLAHLCDLFSRHAIGLDVLSDLTADDLAEMGMALGDRKRVLKAIANWGAAAVSALPRAHQPMPSSAERRQITVLFCDLVGSSQLTAALDPEESRSIIRKYRGVVAEVVEKLGGHIAQYLGDGVLAYFGWPTALEDAAERAVTAGLEIIDAVAGEAALQIHKLQVRQGVATGLVVIGASESGDLSEDMTAVGNVVNIAARLQSLAEPSRVVIAGSTHALVKRHFDVTPLGKPKLKGIAEPVAVFQVDRHTVSPHRKADQRINMLGRDHELRLALDRWEIARTGEGQVLLVTGDAGIGKSYLTDRLVATISATGADPVRLDCSPFEQSTALHPVIHRLRDAAGMADADSPAAQSAKLIAYMRALKVDPALVMPSLVRLLSLADDNWPEPEGTTPMIRKARTFAALTEIVLARATSRPVLIVLEDAHWADPTTFEFFERLMDTCRDQPVMLLINGRPNFRPQWHERGNITSIAMQRLARHDVENMVSALCAGKNLPSSLATSIIERSDGIPLFIEELTKAVLESQSAGTSATDDIPSSLRDTLMARLDRHPEAREVAQFAACIGRECDHELLASVSDMPDAQLDEALSKLSNAEILFRHGNAPHAIYRFKHALVQEAAADSLLKSRRRDIHGRIARFLETRRPEFAVSRPELLAHHFTQALDLPTAVRYRQMAGNQAVAASGNLEAIGEFGQALELITLLPPSEERDRLELDILIAQAIPYTLTKGYAAPEVEAIYRRAMETSARLPQEAQSFAVVYGLWRFHLLRGDYANAMMLSDQLLGMAVARKDTTMDVTSNRAAGATRFYLARYEESLAHLGRAAGIDADETLRKTILSYDVVDPWVVNTAYSGMALWIHGRPSAAMEQSERAIVLAREVNHPFTLALALCFAQWTYQFQRNRERVLALSAEALELSNRYGFTFWTGWAELMLAWAESGSDPASARRRMKTALPLWQSTGSELGLSYFQCLVAEQCDGAEARLLLDAAAKFARDREEFFWLPEIYRMSGHHALREGYEDAASCAETAFIAALESAEKLSARGLALRAALDIVRLPDKLTSQHDALKTLRRYTTSFDDGDGFDDLVAARQLLKVH